MTASPGWAAGRRRARAAELLDALELGVLAKRKVQTLSGGQRRRPDVALGLVHWPRLRCCSRCCWPAC